MSATALTISVFIAALALFAGCLSPENGGRTPAAAAEPVDLFAGLADGLPCDAPIHDGLTDNLRLIATESYRNTDETDHREIDTHRYADGRTLLIAWRLSGGGFDVVDITDPQYPDHLVAWITPSGGGQDVKFTTDGTAVVYSNGAVLEIVDMRDPLDPRLESTYVLEKSGAHMVAAWSLDGTEYVSISKGEDADVSIFVMSGTAGNRTLERVSHPFLMQPAPAAPLFEDIVATPRSAVFETRSHDTWFETDPMTGTPLLWVANAFWGVTALDVTDPSTPEMIFHVPHEDGMLGYVHTAQVTHLDGKRYVVGASEYGAGLLKVWDATDLAHPRLVAKWHDDSPTYPNHNMQVVGPYVYVAHFHDGAYIFDLRMMQGGWIDPMAHVPARIAENALPRVPVSPGQWYYGPVDVVLQDGIVWVNQAEMGTEAYAFGCVTPGDATQTSTG